MNVIELRVDTFRVCTIESVGFGRRMVDIKQHDSLASAEADANDRFAKSASYCQISLAVDSAKFTVLIGRYGGRFIECGGTLYQYARNSGWHYDCWPVYRPEAAEFMDTSDPKQVTDWVRITGSTPDPSWPCVATYTEEPWKSKVTPGNNCIDMQFDHPGWQPSGVKRRFTLSDGTVIESGRAYQRRPSVYVAEVVE